MKFKSTVLVKSLKGRIKLGLVCHVSKQIIIQVNNHKNAIINVVQTTASKDHNA